MTVLEIISIVFLIVGAFFMLVAGIGMVRMPDLFTRMSAATKAATLGAGLMLIGMALYFWDVTVTTRVIAIIVFMLATVPVSAHMIGRAAYADGVPLWEGTQYDELKGRYDEEKQILASSDPAESSTADVD